MRTAARTDTAVPPDTVTVNCADGCVTSVPLTPDQVAAQQATASQVAAQQQADASARAQLVAAVATSTDPAIRALAKLIGVIS